MRPLARIASVDDFRAAARRRLPRLVFDYIDGGAETESALARNRAAFDDVRLMPRVMCNVATRDLAVDLLGVRHAAPLGIAPTGLANLAGHGVDLVQARAAAALGLPYTLSTAATTSIEDTAAALGDEAASRLWFQLYMPADRVMGEDLVARAQGCGVRTLVVTADVPMPGRRWRDVRNGFALPFRRDLGMLLDFAMHPAWALGMLRHGEPRLANWERYARGPASAQSLAALQANQIDPALVWDDLARLRERWPHRLLLKGVMHPDDGRRAAALGVDGLVVSNHGGRQFDAAPATLEALPALREAVGPSMALVLDGGVRSGTDVIKAMSRGADFCLIGRPALYAAAAYGQAGVEHLLHTMMTSAATALGLMGQCGLPLPSDARPPTAQVFPIPSGERVG